MRKAQFFYLLRRGLLSGGLNFIKEGLVMASKFTTQGLSFPSTGSAEFNGSSDYIQLDNPFSHTNHTIAAWVYVDGSNKTIFDNRNANNDGIRLIQSFGNTLYYQLNDRSLTTTINSNTWYFITASYDGVNQKLYVDGSQLSSQSATESIDVSTYNAVLGKGTFENNYFNGNLANVAIWNRALSSDEINSVMWKSYEALSGAESNGLQAWYSLDDITSPAASLANMEQLATDKNATIENKAAITAAINALS
jgi:hypothetical protein